MILYRNYRDEDFEDVLGMLNDAMEFDSFERFLLDEKLYLDPEWDPGTTWLALDDSRLVGFLQGVRRVLKAEHYGYIKLMAVHKSYRRRGIASELLTKFETELLNDGKTSALKLFDVPLNYFMPGIDPAYTPAVCFFEKKGFKKIGETVNMIVDLTSSEWETDEKEEELRKHDIHIKRIDPDEERELMKLISTEWQLWEYELKMSMKSDPPAVFIAKTSEGIKAFSAWDGNNQGTGWFGPMGTHPDLRGKGLGSVLLFRCLRDMKLRGFDNSTIPWVGPVSFYSHYSGARISRVFWRYEKKLTNKL